VGSEAWKYLRSRVGFKVVICVASAFNRKWLKSASFRHLDAGLQMIQRSMKKRLDYFKNLDPET
jgi:hypothetical protein